MTKPIRCQCKGCTRCSPERGPCERPPGDYPGEYYCEDCHQEAARVMFDAQPQTNLRGRVSGMNAVLAAWEHHRRIQQGWTRAAIRAQGVNVDDAQKGVVSVDVRLHGQADVMFRPGTGSLSVEGKEPEVGDGSPAQRELLITAGILVLGDNIAEGQLFSVTTSLKDN